MPGLSEEQVEELIEFLDAGNSDGTARRILYKIRELQAPKKKYVELEDITSLVAARTFSSCINLHNLDDFFLQLDDYAKTLEELKCQD